MTPKYDIDTTPITTAECVRLRHWLEAHRDEHLWTGHVLSIMSGLDASRVPATGSLAGDIEHHLGSGHEEICTGYRALTDEGVDFDELYEILMPGFADFDCFLFVAAIRHVRMWTAQQHGSDPT